MKISITALYGCGECIAPPDWDTTALPRPYRLYYVLGGRAYYSVGGERHELRHGCFYLFPSSMNFNVTQDESDRLNHLYFDFMMTPSIISAEPLCVHTDEHSLLSTLLTLMRDAVNSYRYRAHSELRDTVISVLEAFLSLFLEIKKPTKTMDKDVALALEYIEQNYSSDISVKEIARLLFLDEDYFIKKFKRAIGIPPYAYIKNLRMAVVRELRSLGEPLNTAALSAGFKYASSYCRARSKDEKN